MTTSTLTQATAGRPGLPLQAVDSITRALRVMAGVSLGARRIWSARSAGRPASHDDEVLAAFLLSR